MTDSVYPTDFEHPKKGTIQREKHNMYHHIILQVQRDVNPTGTTNVELEEVKADDWGLRPKMTSYKVVPLQI